MAQPFPGGGMGQVVTKDAEALGPQYNVNPWQGMTQVASLPSGWYDPGMIIRPTAVAVRLPWTPQSYPAVGREPAQFPPPDVPATPAVQGQGARSWRKAQLGRTVASGSPTSAPGGQIGT